MALVTGASSGIGATFARQIAEDGYGLVLVARRTERLEELAAELRAKHGVPAETMAADLTRDEDVDRVARRLADSANLSANLELLVNNAGFGTKGFFFEADAAQQDAMHRLHVLATERLTRAALPGMMARRRGGIVNVASVAGFMQSPGSISYMATKAWMISFTEGLHMELKILGSPVVVQALCPGYTYSEFHDVMGADRGEISKSFWMPADFVVRESLRGLKEGKLFVIPGWRYRAIVRLAKLVPRPIFEWGATRVRKPRRV
jgi:short-subunit dehydrogenase